MANEAAELKLVARELLLPAVKEIWPDASQVVTGAQLVWASVEFWNQLADDEADATERTIAGVKLLGSVVGLGLSLYQAPALAQTTNTVAGLVITTAGKVYAARAALPSESAIGN